MSDGRHTANREPGHGTNPLGVLPGPSLAGLAEHPLFIESVVTRDERQDGASRGFTPEEEGFHDLAHFAAERGRRINRRSGRGGQLPYTAHETVQFEGGIDFPSRRVTHRPGRHAKSQLGVDAEVGYHSSGAGRYGAGWWVPPLPSRGVSCVFNTGP